MNEDEDRTIDRLREHGERRQQRREFFRAIAAVAGVAGSMQMAMTIAF